MRKSKLLFIFVSLMDLLILSSIIADRAGSQEVESLQGSQESEASASRKSVVDAALSNSDLFDCGTYRPDRTPILPAEQQIFQIVRDVQITPHDGKEYWGAIWSPKGDKAVFGVWTGELREIPDSNPQDALSGRAVPVAVSTIHLVLYSLTSGTWEEITSDGKNPTWSRDGQSLYYMAGGTELAKVDIATRKKNSTGLNAPHTGIGLIWSQPLSDGRLMAPRRPDGPLEVYGGAAPPLSLSGVLESDVIKLSPKEDRVVIGYGAISAEPITVIHNLRTSEVTPLFKNCQLSAVELAWSQGGDQLAYPIHADPPEVRIYNVKSGRTQVLLRPDTFAHLGSLSWSPDGRYLVVTQNAGELESSIWMVSTNGTVRQRLVEGGLMPNWSPDGTHLLYARRQENGQPLDWYLLELQPVEFKKGGQDQ